MAPPATEGPETRGPSQANAPDEGCIQQHRSKLA